MSLQGLKRWRKWGTLFKKSSDPYLKVEVGGDLASVGAQPVQELFCRNCVRVEGARQEPQPRVQVLLRDPGRCLSGDYEVSILLIKVDEPRGQSVEVTVWDYDPLRLDQ